MLTLCLGQHRANRRPHPLLGRRPGELPPARRLTHVWIARFPVGQDGGILGIDTDEHLLHRGHEQPVQANIVEDFTEVHLVVRDVPDERGLADIAETASPLHPSFPVLAEGHRLQRLAGPVLALQFLVCR
ncbi:hypothetical protein ACQEUU_33730 [Nonomuraea sp. CA-218870]|uniref:hypothetical protein n=1 Tax=Nonomuraea sp. CA-218870 TaxID=3239998 RepID=UPI003D9046C6